MVTLQFSATSWPDTFVTTDAMIDHENKPILSLMTNLATGFKKKDVKKLIFTNKTNKLTKKEKPSIQWHHESHVYRVSKITDYKFPLLS